MADPKPIIPVPNRPVFIWPTPNHEDLLFWVWRDGTLPKYDHGQWKPGDKFENEIDYPNHRLILVTPQNEMRWSKWYYMANRAEQDLYNWEFTQADIGGTKFDAVARTYVTLREDFDPQIPAMGFAMPDSPEETFDGTYVMAQRNQKRGDPEFDSIFVNEQRVFVKKVTLTDYAQDAENGIANYILTTLYYHGETVPGSETPAVPEVAAVAASLTLGADSSGYRLVAFTPGVAGNSITLRMVSQADGTGLIQNTVVAGLVGTAITLTAYSTPAVPEATVEETFAYHTIGVANNSVKYTSTVGGVAGNDITVSHVRGLDFGQTEPSVSIIGKAIEVTVEAPSAVEITGGVDVIPAGVIGAIIPTTEILAAAHPGRSSWSTDGTATDDPGAFVYAESLVVATEHTIEEYFPPAYYIWDSSNTTADHLVVEYGGVATTYFLKTSTDWVTESGDVESNNVAILPGSRVSVSRLGFGRPFFGGYGETLQDSLTAQAVWVIRYLDTGGGTDSIWRGVGVDPTVAAFTADATTDAEGVPSFSVLYAGTTFTANAVIAAVTAATNLVVATTLGSGTAEAAPHVPVNLSGGVDYSYTPGVPAIAAQITANQVVTALTNTVPVAAIVTANALTTGLGSVTPFGVTSLSGGVNHANAVAAGANAETVEALFADTDNAFWGSDGTGYGYSGRQLSEGWFAVIYKQVLNLDDEYTIRVDKLRPPQFVCPQTSRITASITTNNTPGVPAVPTVTAGQMIEVSKRGRIEVLRTTTQPGTPLPLKGTTVDNRTGQVFVETTELVDTGQVHDGVVSSAGILVTYDPISACWSRKTTTQAASTLVREWFDVIKYDWPPVLLDLTLESFSRRNGPPEFFARYHIKQGFNEPQTCLVTEKWQKDSLSAEEIDELAAPMVPTSMQYSCPLYTVAVPPCLHEAKTFSFAITGNASREFFDCSGSYTVPATTLTDWPAHITLSESKPHLGGFIITKTRIPRPEV